MYIFIFLYVLYILYIYILYYIHYTPIQLDGTISSMRRFNSIQRLNSFRRVCAISGARHDGVTGSPNLIESSN